MKVRYILWLVPLWALLASCSQKRYPPILQAADSLAENAPDSTLHLLHDKRSSCKNWRLVSLICPPFFPQWQIGDMTIGTYSGDFSSDDSSDSTGEMLLLFGLNAIEDR